MWFLIFEILILLLAAAAAGGGLVYWWFKNRYEDVTDSYSSYRRRAVESAEHATKGDVERSMKALLERIEKLDRDPDFSPIDRQLGALQSSVAGIEFPETDLSQLETRLYSIEERLDAPDQAIGAIQSDIDKLEGNVARILSAVSMLHNADFSGVEGEIEKVADRLDTVELKLDSADQPPSLDEMAAHFTGAFVEAAPKPDLSAVEDRLAAVEQSIGRITFPKTDLSPVTDGLGRLERAIASIPPAEKPDLSPVLSAVAVLEERFGDVRDTLSAARAGDLETVQNGFAALRSSIAAIPAPDLEPVLLRLSGLERTVAGIEPIETRLSAVQDAIAGHRQPDLSPVLSSVRAMDSRLDLTALENRLTSIEYGLAAVHHMLRSKAELIYANGEQMYDINSPGDFTKAPIRGSKLVARPPRTSDPINPARRADDRANLLIEPAFGAADDLTLISGIGPMLHQLLNEIGVYYLWQIAEWTDEEIEWVDGKLLHFSGRIKRDDWVGQAHDLAARSDTAIRPAALSPEPGASESV